MATDNDRLDGIKRRMAKYREMPTVDFRWLIKEVERFRSELQTSNDCHISEVNRFTKERDDLKELNAELEADIINYKQVEKHYLSLITIPLEEEKV
ncbi:hypothetical protein LCGC14_1184080 [marine sediment metagenome]|uniref:Uncharacterized protein n=1 Tax=marine sediment metagenome TaxID=412755 RepID=A0A0F9LR30_9ZZZZ|nr:hypothetical protein [Candidatus Aminicenantes bacterium]